MLLNIDAGETDAETEELWSFADILNVACGGHAGDETSMKRLVDFCAHSVRPRIGAHPSYPDRNNFGRVSMSMDPKTLAGTIEDQCEALESIARERNLSVPGVKPHGALYHDAAKSEPIARAFLEGAIEALGWNVIVIGPPRSSLFEMAELLGLQFLREGFADRRARADGTLVPRTEEGALITDPNLAAKNARALQGVDTICVHGDTPSAVAIARAVREMLG
jgi:UPF0271 protein